MNTVNVKRRKSKDQKKQDKNRKPALSHSTLGYQNSIKRFLTGISILLNSVQLKTKFSVILESNQMCRI